MTVIHHLAGAPFCFLGSLNALRKSNRRTKSCGACKDERQTLYGTESKGANANEIQAAGALAKKFRNSSDEGCNTKQLSSIASLKANG